MSWMDKIFPGRTGSSGGTATRPPLAAPDGDHSQLDHSQLTRAPAQSQFPASQGAAAGTPHAARKDLLRLVLRETLQRNGIPTRWLGAEVLRATSRNREPGVHLRFLIRAWDPRLLEHGVAIEENFRKRLLAMDPDSPKWLMGISWQFALEDSSQCPALPHPGWWTAEPHRTEPVAPVQQSSGDVIQGPVQIGSTKADLDQLLAQNDAEAARNRGNANSFAATQPLKLK
jgi:hypothetical protein